jgi:separase
VLLEKQIYALMEKKLTGQQLNLCATEAVFVLELLQQGEYQVYKLRFVNTLIHFALRKNASPSNFPVNTASIEALLTVDKKPAGTVHLRTYEAGLRALLKLQYVFFTASVTTPTLADEVRRLSGIVQQCKTSEQAREALDDVQLYITSLRLAADYTAFFDVPQVGLMAWEALHHIFELGFHAAELSTADVLLQIGKLHDCLQNVSSAQKSFRQLEKSRAAVKVDSLFEAEFAVAYSEHFFSVEDLHQTFIWLERAQKTWECRDETRSTASGKRRLKEQATLCRAAMVASQYAFHRGHLLEAATYARQSVKVAAALWLSIEKIWDLEDSRLEESSIDIEMHSLTVDFSKVDLSSQHSPRLRVDLAGYWPQIALYFAAFGNMASLSAHSGLYQDAIYFHEQALKVARKTTQPSLVSSILSELALLHARAGQSEKARISLQHIPPTLRDNEFSVTRVVTCINQGNVHLLLGDVPSAREHALKAITQLQGDRVRSKQTEVASTVRSKTVKQSSTKTLARKLPTKLPTRRAPAVEPCIQPAPTPIALTFDLKAAKERLETLETTVRLLENQDAAIRHEASPSSIVENPRRSIAEALYLVRSALKLFSNDAVHNVLAETAMAVPVRYKSSRKSGRVSFVQNSTSQAPTDKKTALHAQNIGSNRTASGLLGDGTRVLLEAYQILRSIKETAQGRVCSDIIHVTYKTLAQISLLLTALGHPSVSSSVELVLEALSPLEIARRRERIAILSEVATSDRCSVQKWPSLGSFKTPTTCAASDSVLQYDMSLLPASWSIITLGLNEDRSELLISRLVSHRSPFMVRIPLTRPDLSDAENETMDFDGAKAEMRQIISQANATAHDPRGCSIDKSVRKAWYAERQRLDQQLATLLDNIENVWFGGFRGLLSGSGVDEKALLKFGQRFSMALNRHLPSRRKSSRSSGTQIELHAHVLELFIALGHPREADLDDAITDLLYFVIDILQFGGERNAYDEVDFDAMVVEVLDALNAYHEEQMNEAKERPTSHVMLVLDKELQLFPWESMSCLRGRPASRMPSLGAIWERLDAIRGQQHGRAEGHTIPRADGAYILNPSSDLTSTQDTFGQLFEQQLGGYESIVNRAPEETEFEKVLRDKSLVLYFGHGGGAQYIRGRTIRKLDRCAVTLLMGCSSAKMTECGVYEPYGLPWNYIHGGSPAVVGTLWDVTDRDIDRFTLELMADWGLIDPDDKSVAANKPGKAKGGKRKDDEAKAHTRPPCLTQQQRKGGVPASLDEAVARARDTCLLRYLNGAAPVMYGIPVFLE